MHSDLQGAEAFVEILARAALAVTAGGILGLNRYLHHKPAGVRTHALVALGTALATMVMLRATGADAQSLSRVIQGVVTGVGFIGAGVILHRSDNGAVQGLTTAASVWATAILGVACGVGDYVVGTVGIAFTLLIFVLGRPLERLFGGKRGDAENGH